MSIQQLRNLRELRAVREKRVYAMPWSPMNCARRVEYPLKEDLSINVASYYLQVLYNKEVQKIAELQVALSNEQVVKTEALVKNSRRRAALR